MRQGVVFSVIVLTVLCAPVLAYDWSTNPGDGSPGNPYQINTAEQMMSIEMNGDRYFILMNDIVFDPNNNPDHVFEYPVIHEFTGVMNGNGYTIYNFTFVSNQLWFPEIGFIGHNFGILENVIIRNANITTGVDLCDIGILCGVNMGRLENCSVYGKITADRNCERIGSLCGKNEMLIENCSSSGQISVNGIVDGICKKIGGLIGDNYFEVSNCRSSVAITTEGYSNHIGGLIGYNEGDIYCCEASGDIGSHGNEIGGLVGTNEGGIFGSHAVGDVVGDYKAGGLVGENNATIHECSAEGDIIGYGDESGGYGGYYGPAAISVTNNFTSFNQAFAGGLVGYNSGNIFASLSRGTVLGLSVFGGFAGVNEGTISNSYSSGDVTVPPYEPPTYITQESTSAELNYLYQVMGLGGFAAGNGGDIYNCYSVGNVYADEFALDNGWVGGFIAANTGNVEECFWDIDLQTYGVTESIGINDGGVIINTVGLPTVLMQQRSTFEGAGWYFINEPINYGGCYRWYPWVEDVWWIDEGNDYPRLWFEMNTPPVSDAGKDQRFFVFENSFADVWLDGTGSNDEDGDALEYFWYNDANELIQTGAEPNVVLGVGEHVITLIVNDGTEDSEPDTCIITVIKPIEIAAKVLPGTINAESNREQIVGRLVFAGESEPVLDPNEPMLLLVGDAEIEAVEQKLVYSKKETAWYLMASFDSTAVIENLTANTETEIKLVARFEAGQWVYGHDMVKVK